MTPGDETEKYRDQHIADDLGEVHRLRSEGGDDEIDTDMTALQLAIGQEGEDGEPAQGFHEFDFAGQGANGQAADDRQDGQAAGDEQAQSAESDKHPGKGVAGPLEALEAA